MIIDPNKKYFCLIHPFEGKPEIVHELWSEVNARKKLSCRGLAYETLEELIEKEQVITCSVCGCQDGTHYVHGEKLRANKTCINCDFWLNDVDPNKTLRVNGGCYQIGPEPNLKAKPRFGLGFGGSKFEFRTLTGEVIVSHNVWFGGRVPEHFKSRLPDNAAFVDDKRWVEVDGVFYLQGLIKTVLVECDNHESIIEERE